MDFFGAQTRARRNSFWLALWFGLAVVGTVAVSYFGVNAVLIVWKKIQTGLKYGIFNIEDIRLFAFVALFVVDLGITTAASVSAKSLRYFCYMVMNVFLLILFVPGLSLLKGEQLAWWDFNRFCWTSIIVGTGIALGTIYKIMQITQQGAACIALDLGGERLSRSTRDSLEQRLFNVVDEMSIAAGIVPPQVYVLKEETKINAFAVGFGVSNNIIVITQGALDKLSRDELQVLIAHEIGHIANGDARFNLRLIGLLHGLLMLSIASLVAEKAAKAGY